MYLKSFKELIVWQKSMDLAVLIFEVTSKFPKSELYGLTSQMRRAVVSIPSNIAEGYGRRSKKEFRQFILIAYSSALELETQLLLAKRLEFVSIIEFEKTYSVLQETQKMLNSLSSKLNG